ncbi:hypothetical protein EVAR_85766_1 [Eumeta japonica]|uniref:Uncharacterized protein n=1 Tax=Eumeta variegata TaxID=151549 RepID=A0A4C1ZHN0_EUMVA|nr:hypothetical protein EVAR_85766_1 [Eumeta japonica]
MWCPRSREAGERHGWLAADSFSRWSQAALGGSVGFGFTHGLETGRRRQPGLLAVCCWRQFTQEGFSPDSRVRGHSLVQCGTNISRSAGRMTVGGRVAHYNWQQWHCLDLLSCAGPPRIPEGHTMFRLLNIFLASSVLGRTARTSHNGEPSLRQSMHRVLGKPWRRGRLGFRLPGSRLSLLDRSGEGFASFARDVAPMMGLCPSPAGREPPSLLSAFLSARLFYLYEGKDNTVFGLAVRTDDCAVGARRSFVGR